VEDGAIIGGRSVFKPGIRVGRNSVIAMASVVTKDVLPDTVVMGHPARLAYSRAEYDKKKKDWESKR
jgi:acetyltransferase-like isoleucine patch superfamily enzyme